MTRAESALATARRLAEVAVEEKRLGRIISAASACIDGGWQRSTDFDLGDTRVSHLSMYLGNGGAPHRERMRACPTCQAAYQAIQDRKAVRRRRGALRAALVRIGKLALKEADGA